MRNFFLKHKICIILGLILLVGFGLRAYHFSSWLHFELDQARDARVVDAALQGGPGELPLLGPKAGGTFLRLGPAFYNLEYVSALFFGGTPTGMAIFVLIFSSLSIPLFYSFIRRFFGEWLSLGLTLLFSVSEFFIMYGRFAWNPNFIPFFVLLGFYALLRAVDESETYRERWFLLSVGALALATQFHFLVFIAVPAIFFAFLILKRPRYSWKTWLGACAIVFILYLPMALNEIETGGANTKEFFGAITEKSSKTNHTFIEKVSRDVSEHGLHALVITTGFEKGTFPTIIFNGGLKWSCTDKCDQGKWYGVFSVLLFILGISALLLFWWKETDQKKKDFLVLSSVWLVITFGLFLPLSYNIAPRFFLLSGLIFFILLGMIFELLRRVIRHSKAYWIIIVGIVFFLSYSNVQSLCERYRELSLAGTEAIDSPPDRILKDRIRVTLEQQNRIVDMLQKRSQDTGYPVYMFSEPQHRRALKYLMEKRGIENAVLGFDGIYKEGVYYLVLRAQSDLEDSLKKYRKSYTVGATTHFGTLVAIELLPKPESIMAERQDFSITKPSDSKAPPRYTWKEFFERTTGPKTNQDETSLEQSEDEATDQQ